MQCMRFTDYKRLKCRPEHHLGSSALVVPSTMRVLRESRSVYEGRLRRVIGGQRTRDVQNMAHALPQCLASTHMARGACGGEKIKRK